jgi:hypothetical protein
MPLHDYFNSRNRKFFNSLLIFSKATCLEKVALLHFRTWHRKRRTLKKINCTISTNLHIRVDGIIMKRPTSVGQLLGKSKWEKRLADWIMATGVGLLGCGLCDFEAERVERNDGWRREPFVWEETGYIYERGRPGFVFSYLLFSLFLCLLSIRCLFPYQWGLIPRMGKTHR